MQGLFWLLILTIVQFNINCLGSTFSSVYKITIQKNELLIDAQIRPINFDTHDDIDRISEIIRTNFKNRTEMNSLCSEVRDMYERVNKSQKLGDTVQKCHLNKVLVIDKDKYGLKDEIHGVILAMLETDPEKIPGENKTIPSLILKRLHTSMESEKLGFRGIGSALLQHLNDKAKLLGIPRIITTATITSKDFFEKRGWKGREISKIVKTDDSIGKTKEITISQFLCEYTVFHSSLALSSPVMSIVTKSSKPAYI